MGVDRPGRFTAAKNFALYYGAGRDLELARFNVAVVEPAGQSEASLRRMQQSGTLVLAYLSVMEVPPWDPVMKLLKKDDFIYSGEKPMVNEYGNHLVRLRPGRWTGLLLHRAGSLLHRFGYDGLFLDTIGDVEWPDFAPEIRSALLPDAAAVVRRMREIFPGHILVQNNGLESLCLLTARYLNGICWENPLFDDSSYRRWTEDIIARLVSLKSIHGLRVLLLLEEKDGTGGTALADINYRLAGEIAGREGFLLYRSPGGYVSGVNPPEGGGWS